MSYVVQEYDFFNAITKKLNLSSPEYKHFHILNVTPVFDNASIVKTTHGDYYCESWEDKDATIYMRVSQYL